MRARGDFGHDAAERTMRRLLPARRWASTRRSEVTRAAAVSSHEDSRPRINTIAWHLGIRRRLVEGRFCFTIGKINTETGLNDIIRIGTRGSPLALVQANMVKDLLAAAHGLAGEIVIIKTTGDKVQDRALAEIGGKALWTKELDRALLDGEIDCAVHSMKDVETIRPAAIVIAAMLPRADVRDRRMAICFERGEQRALEQDTAMRRPIVDRL
jgi:hypothetical protein